MHTVYESPTVVDAKGLYGIFSFLHKTAEKRKMNSQIKRHKASSKSPKPPHVIPHNTSRLGSNGYSSPRDRTPCMFPSLVLTPRSKPPPNILDLTPKELWHSNGHAPMDPQHTSAYSANPSISPKPFLTSSKNAGQPIAINRSGNMCGSFAFGLDLCGFEI